MPRGIYPRKPHKPVKVRQEYLVFAHTQNHPRLMTLDGEQFILVPRADAEIIKREVGHE